MIRPVCPRRIFFVIVRAALLATVLLAAQRAAADGGRWLVDARRAPVCGPCALWHPAIAVRRCDEHGRWAASDEAALHAAAADVPLVIFVHGNRSTLADAIEESRCVYTTVRRAAAGRDFCFLVWSWPAERIRGIRRDEQTKAAYADHHACYLAGFLSRLPRQSAVCLVGYSFGARMIPAALHVLGGGEVGGQALLPREPQPRRIRAVLAAAAMGSGWLAPGRRDGEALAQVEAMLVTVNHTDSALRWYPRLYGRGGPSALGFTGPTRSTPCDRLQLLDVTFAVGHSHHWRRYCQSAALRSLLPTYAFLDCP